MALFYTDSLWFKGQQLLLLSALSSHMWLSAMCCGWIPMTTSRWSCPTWPDALSIRYGICLIPRTIYIYPRDSEESAAPQIRVPFLEQMGRIQQNLQLNCWLWAMHDSSQDCTTELSQYDAILRSAGTIAVTVIAWEKWMRQQQVTFYSEIIIIMASFVADTVYIYLFLLANQLQLKKFVDLAW